MVETRSYLVLGRASREKCKKRWYHAVKKSIHPSPSDVAAYLFHQGTNYRAQEYLGAHRTEEGTYVFRVWAPNATGAFVVGDFNGWGDSLPMIRETEGGIWAAVLDPDVFSFGEGSVYKFKFETPNGIRLKADPYARCAQKPPETASVYTELDGYTWHDESWLSHRRRTMSPAQGDSRPINIYELHLGSWKRHEDGTVYTYEETARELIPYVKQMGYTHIELMPVMEHPYDGSWGYQVTGYFAPTSRYGTPHQFMAFIDAMHAAGIGVILDWVPAHFPKDAHGLYEFDGQPLYEYQGRDRMEHRGWGTRCFDLGRQEVECFLVSNAAFWVEMYHADGLRVDAVASMLYLDYDRMPDEWVPNVYGDNRSLEAIAFFRKLNGMMAAQYPDVLTIAEESGDYGNLTSFRDGGLGFRMKWNMGWMNDSLTYASLDAVYRKYHHDRITFSLIYAFHEKYTLPISHDEVVHGKKSLLDRMSGDYWQKFAGCRAFLGYMMTHPGKKLLFMGCELGQFREWDYEDQLEWFLLDYDAHAAMQYYVAELNHWYLQTPALYEIDGSWDGFRWIDADNSTQSVLSYRRIDKKGHEIIVAVNFTPVVHEDFWLGVPDAGTYEEIFNSDDVRFGGSGVVNVGTLHTTPVPNHNLPATLRFRLPPLAMVAFRCKRRDPRKC